MTKTTKIQNRCASCGCLTHTLYAAGRTERGLYYEGPGICADCLVRKRPERPARTFTTQGIKLKGLR